MRHCAASLLVPDDDAADPGGLAGVGDGEQIGEDATNAEGAIGEKCVALVEGGGDSAAQNGEIIAADNGVNAAVAGAGEMLAEVDVGARGRLGILRGEDVGGHAVNGGLGVEEE